MGLIVPWFLIVPSTIYIGAHLIYVYTSSWNISPIWYTSDENGLSSSHIGYKRTNIWRKERKTDELLSNYSSLMLQRETLLQKVMNPWNFIAFSLHNNMFLRNLLSCRKFVEMECRNLLYNIRLYIT
jgi:hypothetical protein